MSGPSTPFIKRDAGSGRWHIFWQENGKTKKRSTGTVDRREAEKALGRFLLEDRTVPEPGAASAPTATVASIWPAYALSLRGTPTHVRLVAVWARLEPAFGDRSVISLCQDDIDSYAAARVRMGGAAPGTVRLELVKLQAAISLAVQQRVVDEADKPRLRLPAAPEAHDRWLSREEASRLLAACAQQRDETGRLSRSERFVWIALATGARRRAIETLTWDQVDFETGVIHFKPDGIAQTTKRRPSVPISTALRETLDLAYAQRGVGNPYVLDGTREVYSKVVRAASIAGVRDVTPHVLRHTAATWMARKGVPIWRIAGILGNTVAMTEAVYAKHCPEDQRAAVETLFA
jgi:integrase